MSCICIITGVEKKKRKRNSKETPKPVKEKHTRRCVPRVLFSYSPSVSAKTQGEIEKTNPCQRKETKQKVERTSKGVIKTIRRKRHLPGFTPMRQRQKRKSTRTRKRVMKRTTSNRSVLLLGAKGRRPLKCGGRTARTSQELCKRQ
jgi:hypothetical protein